MELKTYQKQAIKSLQDFFESMEKNKTISQAFKEFWESHNVKIKTPYQNNIPGVPQVCFKVPTGGGKTFMAAASIKTIYDFMENKIVVWLVPSETILTQTYKNLSDPSHAYRQFLNAAFNEQVEVYNKAQLLAGENFSPDEVEDNGKISICVLSYDSFRTSNKDGRKAFQQNGQLYKFVSRFNDDEEILENADKSSLIQVIRHYKPVIIIDESHHATTNLSLEMLKNFNPRFILELTATPKKNSNIICYVPAEELKKEAMVKLPVIVFNRQNQEEVISDAVNFRNLLEKLGTPEKIRPIVLFQAETKGAEERQTFQKIKNNLIENYKIPAEEIAIKTAEINDLKNTDLKAADCPIRYIITINALKEGWDCSFAYILASLANRSSEIDVEQILGRILRRPDTKNFSEMLLNRSYVLTSSDSFRETLNKIVAGLNAAGYSEKECRAVEELKEKPPKENTTEQQKIFTSDSSTGVANLPVSSETSTTSLEKKAQEVISAGSNSNSENNSDGEGTVPPEGEQEVNIFSIREKFNDAKEILLPQFFHTEDTGQIFGGVEDLKINKEFLSTKFSLKDKDTIINFDNMNYEIVSVDVEKDIPRYKYLSAEEVKALLKYFDNLSPKSQIRECAKKIIKIIDKNKIPSTQEIQEYVTKIISALDREKIRDAIQNPLPYARKIKNKIDSFLEEYAEKKFKEMYDSKKIFTKPSYKFPEKISPLKFQKNWANSLYEAEEKINELEYKVVAALTSVENVLWWHRNISKKGFYINGFINHYPDFIVKMKSGKILIVEAKGDDRDNKDSKQKLKLGQYWESRSDSNKYSYFMVYENNKIEDALSLDDFITRLKAL